MTKHALSPAVPGRRRALLLPLLLCAHVHAAETDLLLSELAGEEYFLDQVPVVLSATRLDQPQYEAPVAVTVLDRAMIEASGVLDITDLLRRVPGFQVAHPRGHTVAATYHRLAAAHAPTTAV